MAAKNKKEEINIKNLLKIDDLTFVGKGQFGAIVYTRQTKDGQLNEKSYYNNMKYLASSLMQKKILNNIQIVKNLKDTEKLISETSEALFHYFNGDPFFDKSEPIKEPKMAVEMKTTIKRKKK